MSDANDTNAYIFLSTVLQRDILHSNLDRAFAKIVEYMSETTRQCKVKMLYSFKLNCVEI